MDAVYGTIFALKKRLNCSTVLKIKVYMSNAHSQVEGGEFTHWIIHPIYRIKMHITRHKSQIK